MIIAQSDKELLQLLAQGEDKAFTTIYDRYWKSTYTAAVKAFGDEAVAQDCVQEVFLSIWKRRTELTEIESLDGYLFTAVKMLVIRTLATNHAKRDKIGSFVKTERTTSPMCADAKIADSEVHKKFWNALEALPDSCKQIYHLYNEKLTHRQIAEKLGIKEKTVNNQFGKIIRRLRSGIYNEARNVSLSVLLATVFLYPFIS